MIRILDENDKQELEQDISELSNEIDDQDDLMKNDLDNLKNGLETFGSYATFQVGTFVWGEFRKDSLKRIATDEIMVFDRDIDISVVDGYRLELLLFQNGAYVTDLAYVTDTYTLAKGTSVKALIRLVDETNAPDNPDILSFLQKVTFKSKIEERFENVNNIISTNKALINSSNQGLDTIGNHCTLMRGTVDAGIVASRKNRVTSDEIVCFAESVTLMIKNGYRFGYSEMNADGSYKRWSQWYTNSHTIPANTYLKPLFAKVTENDNEIADITEYNESVTFFSKVGKEVKTFKDEIEFLPGGVGYPGTGSIYNGNYPTNRFVTRNIQTAPYDLVVGFENPNDNNIYQLVFYPSTDNNEALNQNTMYTEFKYEKCIIPKGSFFRIVYAIINNGTTNTPFNECFENLYVKKYEKQNTASVYNTLIPSKSRIVLHKGLSSVAPENSESAFLLGAENESVYGLECDIQITSDGKFVLYHDEDLSSRTNGSGTINNKTFAEVTSCVYNKNVNGLSEYPNEKICSLETYLKICKKHGKVAICEFKFTNADRNNIDNFKNFVKLLYKTGMQHSTIVISFTASELAKLHHIDKSIYVLCTLMSYDDFDFKTCGLANNYGVNVNYESSSAGSGLTEAQIEDAHSKGLIVGVWTPDSAEVKNNYIEYGIDLITTNTLD